MRGRALGFRGRLRVELADFDERPDMKGNSVAHPRDLFIGQVAANDGIATFAEALAFYLSKPEGDFKGHAGLVP